MILDRIEEASAPVIRDAALSLSRLPSEKAIDEPAQLEKAEGLSETVALRAQLDPEILEALCKEPGFDPDLVWTTAEERRVVLKTDLITLIPAGLVLISLALDRSISYALTDNFLKDVRMNQDQLNTASTLVKVGSIAFDIPFQMLSKRVGPQRFLPLTVIAWGAFTIGQAFVKNHQQLWAIQFFIGVFEAGFTPGFAFYLSRFVTRKDLSVRFSVFYASGQLSYIVGGLASLGILELRGKAGLAGWSWLFIIEGLFTLVVGLLAFAWFPSSAARCRWLSEREAAIVTTRVLVDDHRKASEVKSDPVTLRDITSTLLNWRVMLVVVGFFLATIQAAPLAVYMPSIIKSLGYRRYTANGLVVPGHVLSLFTSIALGFAVRRLGGKEGLFTASLTTCSFAGSLWISLPPNDTDHLVLYFAGLFLIWTSTCFVGIVVSWVSNAVEPRQKPVALGMLAISAQLAGIAGSRVLTAADAPRYRKGFGALAGTSAGAAVVMVVAHYLLRSRAAAEAIH